MNSRPSLALIARRVLLSLSVLMLLALFCAQSPRASAATPAYIRVIHASPAVGTADVFVDGVKLLSSFAFGAVTDYAPVPPGAHKVQIALVGKGINASVITQDLAVQPGVAYTAAAIGTQATGLSIEVFIDNNILAAGQAKARIYNLAPDAGAFDVSASGRTLVSSLNYQQVSNYVMLPTGNYDFTLSAPSTNTMLPLTQTLGSNTVTSIFIIGVVNGSPKIELVPAQVSGVPGVPGTGSDPTPLPQRSLPIATWLLPTLAIVFLCVSVALRRRVVVR